MALLSRRSGHGTSGHCRVAVAVHDTRGSEELLAAKLTDLGSATHTALHLVHVAVVPLGRNTQLMTKAVSLVQRRFQGHLARLPQDCNWLLHVVAVPRPPFSTDRHIDMLIARSLCRKAAELSCSELVLKGRGAESAWMSLLLGTSISHLCSEFSNVPLVCWTKRTGWRLVQGQGLASPGYTPQTWQEVTTPSAVPVIAGQLVEQPDGRVHAIHLDLSSMHSGS